MRRQVLLSALLAAVGAPWNPRNELPPPPLPACLSPARAISDVDEDRGRAVGDARPPTPAVVIAHRPKFGGGGLRAGWSGGRSPGGGLWRWRLISSGSRDGAFIVVIVTGRLTDAEVSRERESCPDDSDVLISRGVAHRRQLWCPCITVSACRRACLIGR